MSDDELLSVSNIVLSWLTNLPLGTYEISGVTHKEWQELYRMLNSLIQRAKIEEAEEIFNEIFNKYSFGEKSRFKSGKWLRDHIATLKGGK